ncbi:MAG: PQQ-binding-like beta-propeller repeat protein [Acidobacteriota bacterium]
MKHCLPALLAVLLLAPLAGPALADEMTQFGYDRSRNMISDATGLPSEWDLDSGKNVKWRQAVGSQSYAGPVIGGGVVLIGTNNEGARNPDIKGDKGNIMAFDEETGEFLWQIIHDKLPESKLHDWPLQGVCSTPVIEGDIFYYVSNRAELVAADLHGFRDGENDGPFKDEKLTGEYAGDILWKYDTMGDLDVFPHNLAVSSPIIVDDLIFITSGNGVDEGHINVPSPFAPSFMAFNKKTGELVWENADPGENILHGTWSNPSYGVIGGKPQIIMPGGDGVVYSFEPETGKLIWSFDANPEGSVWRLGGSGTKNNIISMGVVHDDKVYIGVGQDPEHGEGPGNFWVIDGTKTGDITKTGAVWHRGGEDFNRTISTAAIHDGIVYITDLSGFLYALDAKSGEHYWTYDAFAAVWGSPYVADGKVYLGDEDGDIAVLAAGKELKELGEHNLGAAVYTTPLAKDGVLYILARNELFAIEEGASPKPAKTEEPAKAAKGR